MGHKYMPHQQDSDSGFAMEPHRGARQNGYSQCSSVIHPRSAVGSSLNKTTASTKHKPELRELKSHKPLTATDLFNSSSRKDDRLFFKESGMVRNSFLQALNVLKLSFDLRETQKLVIYKKLNYLYISAVRTSEQNPLLWTVGTSRGKH